MIMHLWLTSWTGSLQALNSISFRSQLIGLRRPSPSRKRYRTLVDWKPRSPVACQICLSMFLKPKPCPKVGDECVN